MTPARIRQVVVAAHDLEATTAELRHALGLGQPFADPAVGAFGLRNAVFALGDTFLEVVSPVEAGAAAARLLRRRGGDCGYMVMIQLDDLEGVRARAATLGVREVLNVSLADMEEVHWHPADMRGAIVSASRPAPPASWRWGGPEWQARSAATTVTGVTLAVREADRVRERWEAILGREGVRACGIVCQEDEAEPGLVEVRLSTPGAAPEPVVVAGVRFVPPRLPVR